MHTVRITRVCTLTLMSALRGLLATGLARDAAPTSSRKSKNEVPEAIRVHVRSFIASLEQRAASRAAALIPAGIVVIDEVCSSTVVTLSIETDCSARRRWRLTVTAFLAAVLKS